MRLSRALEEKLLDLRLRDKLVAEGKVTKAQVAQFLEKMQDDEANVTTTDESTKPGMNK